MRDVTECRDEIEHVPRLGTDVSSPEVMKYRAFIACDLTQLHSCLESIGYVGILPLTSTHVSRSVHDISK